VITRIDVTVVGRSWRLGVLARKPGRVGRAGAGREVFFVGQPWVPEVHLGVDVVDIDDMSEEVLQVAFCDVASDYTADPTAAPPPPWLPLSGPLGYAHISPPHAGKYSFAIMERRNNRVCAALTRRKTPTSQTAFAYVLADESSVEGVLRYDPVTVTGLPALPSGSYATLTQVGTTWLVTATTGNSQGDGALGLPGQALFEPIGGPSPFPLVARRTAATVCARLFAAHP
jgi:hypothetical protein